MSLKNPVTSPGIDPGTVRLVAQRLNHYATAGTIYIYIYIYRKREKDRERNRERETGLKEPKFGVYIHVPERF